MTPNLIDMVEELAAIGCLSNWEQDFISNMQQLIDNEQDLSPKQHATLIQIWELRMWLATSLIAEAVMEDLRQQFIARRKELGMRQEDVAKISRLSQSGISHFERGDVGMTMTGLLAYARAVKLALSFRVEER